MDLQSLVRQKIIGNVKMGTKSEKGFPQKLPYFNVEEDKVTSKEFVNIFKKLYPNKPTKLRIRFKSEEPFNFKYKRYVNEKPVCIGDNSKAITIGKDSKGNNTQITIECNKECQQRISKKCKLVGSLVFEIEGINAGGLWKISTGGGYSLSNIATEIMESRNAGLSIIDVPFELSLSEQESLAYGTYYSIELKRMDIKPSLTEGVSGTLNLNGNIQQEPKQLTEGEDEKKKNAKKTKTEVNKTNNNELKENTDKQENIDVKVQETKKEDNQEKQDKNTTEDYSNYLYLKMIEPITINNIKFNKLIFQDVNSQDVEYLLHPRANQEIISFGYGSVIELVSSKMEMEHNILCKYNVKQIVSADGELIENENQELKKAV